MGNMSEAAAAIIDEVRLSAMEYLPFINLCSGSAESAFTLTFAWFSISFNISAQTSRGAIAHLSQSNILEVSDFILYFRPSGDKNKPHRVAG